MALTAYCKKCNREVEPGEVCPRCGTRLAKSATHAFWMVERRPVTDWMCWNAVMRWLLPAGAAVLLLALVLEGLSGGMEAVERLFQGGFPLTLLALLGGLILLVFLALLLQGREWVEYTIDSRGVHTARFLPQPTAIKLMTRLKSPGLMAQVDAAAETPTLLLEQRDLPWREVSRVQLWPEKCYILFYAPTWWLRIPVRCTPFSWDDALYYVKDKLGKKKAVDLPEHLRTQTPKKASTRRTTKKTAPQSPPVSPWPQETTPFADEPDAVISASPWPEEEEDQEAVQQEMELPAEGQVEMELPE